MRYFFFFFFFFFQPSWSINGPVCNGHVAQKRQQYTPPTTTTFLCCWHSMLSFPFSCPVAHHRRYRSRCRRLYRRCCCAREKCSPYFEALPIILMLYVIKLYILRYTHTYILTSSKTCDEFWCDLSFYIEIKKEKETSWIKRTDRLIMTSANCDGIILPTDLREICIQNLLGVVC